MVDKDWWAEVWNDNSHTRWYCYRISQRNSTSKQNSYTYRFVTGLQFENLLWSRYPPPLRRIHNQEKNLPVKISKTKLGHASIHGVPTTIQNAQANPICKIIHQTITKVLHILVKVIPSHNIGNIAELADRHCILSSCNLQDTLHSTLGISYGILVFHGDMLHNFSILPNSAKGQALMDENIQQPK